MKASELRIGNRIYTIEFGEEYPQELTVESIHESGINVEASDDNKPYGQHLPIMEVDVEWKHAEPIPLDEEWLERFGFKKNNNAWILKEPNPMKFGHGEFSIWDQLKEENYRLNATQWTTELLYVHSLQNLYYALTGEELTIKELIE